ncbi:tryptophan-rich sensory protein [Fictibacillus nanhaiensis]|uniref:TspO/MBR family protein n=1 Tax=Fictibacillus nanhaiensis TaxID=742169 RepID=UPI001C97CEE5|nr:TspO/MBR family protein [Fictibacillus nanhaiensis]MBY6035842.1 tryptophan-rich sensory protein [Fictibacillus nanhaiensis]
MVEKTRPYLNILSLAAVIFVNYLANALPLNGNTTGELSAKYNVLITPAGYAFSIWGLIYTMLVIWVIYQASPRHIHNPMFQKLGYWFVVNCMLNIIWIFVWHYEKLYLSLIVMIGLLISLIVIYTKLQGKDLHPWFVRIPFSIYLGWVSVATIVNTAVVLNYSGWDGFGLSSETWTFIMLIVAVIISLLFTVKNDDLAYPLVFVWALVGIGIRHMNSMDILANTSFSLAAFLLLFIIWRGSKRKNILQPMRT